MNKYKAYCIRIRQFKSDIKTLTKKYHRAEESIIRIERLLAAGESLPQTERYPGFGERKIFKTRLIMLGSNEGKSGGHRLIYEELELKSKRVVILITIYSHSIYKDEKAVLKEINSRLRDPDYPTASKLESTNSDSSDASSNLPR